jgi:A/G-specific adenine glycosylase
VRIEKEKIDLFQGKIINFYNTNKRELPWRLTHDPYDILISEFMLQQTQVNRVIDYYTNWIEKWSTVEALSDASFYDVVSTWIGLGYNRRAKYLHETAKIIVHKFKGNVLKAMKSYDQLPGIGEYTSKAVRIFAGNEDITTIDTNIRRIFIHEFNLEESTPDKDLYEIANYCLPKGKSRLWHNALMDYGALVLTSHKTGIKPKTKQSKFAGSDRQIRGQILRLLLKKSYSIDELNAYFRIDINRLKTILNKMIQDNIIQNNDDIFYLMKE